MTSWTTFFVHDAGTQLPRGSGGMAGAFAQGWDEMAGGMESILCRTPAMASWLEQALRVRSRVRVLAARHMDAALLHCLRELQGPAGRSAGVQALVRMLVAGEVARRLDYGAGLVAQLERAAITLSLPVAVLQERLSRLIAPLPGESMRELLLRYAEEALWLGLDGCDGDPIWVETVRQYRCAAPQALPSFLMTPAQHLAVLLRRVDRFCMRMILSRQAPATTLQAVDCAGSDPMAAALVEAVGLYPPGSLVQLENGEIGMVLARGESPHQPQVAVFAHAWHMQALPPQLCDTAQPGWGVCAMLSAAQLPVQAPLQALLQLDVPRRRVQGD